jgi:hypothetical protein
MEGDVMAVKIGILACAQLVALFLIFRSKKQIRISEEHRGAVKDRVKELRKSETAQEQRQKLELEIDFGKEKILFLRFISGWYVQLAIIIELAAIAILLALK